MQRLVQVSPDSTEASRDDGMLLNMLCDDQDELYDEDLEDFPGLPGV
jgi:hypothetical protein